MCALNEKYHELCKQKAQELKEEGFSATLVTKSPSCENKKWLENITAPTRDDLIEESVSEDVAAKELFAFEAGDRDAEEPGDLEKDVTAQDDEGTFLTNVGIVSDPFEANTQNDWPEVKINDGQLEPLALYDERDYAAVEGEGYIWYRVNVVKTDGTSPARFEKHIGKTVEANGVMWEVNNVLSAVKICDWGRGRWDAECF